MASDMKPQFSTRALLLFTAFIAISAGGIIPIYRNLSEKVPVTRAIYWDGYDAALLGPLLVPILFATYAAGRRALNVKIVIAFAIAEAAACALYHSGLLSG